MILFLAGTSDARDLAIRLQQEGHQLLATVVTPSAAESLQQASIPHRIGRLTAAQMVDIIKTEGVHLLVDASHPFAEEASKQAMAAAQEADVPYIRYERAREDYAHPLITTVASYEAAAQLAKDKGGTIMLTTGSKTLATFTKVLLPVEGIRVIARMLPNLENMEKCAALGVAQKDIVAIQGPFTKELNHALYTQYGVTLMVTKASGKVGSVDEKISSALELGIEIIMIDRPNISYGQQFSTFEEISQLVGGMEDVRK
ncbi:precorrin-6A reductase [Metasolibacillus meyeri]|uniref:precorrin-6A reductase n=1 Tax=Metasolibacillus meyeri TaxID=1071052 RepID=UPI000D2FCE2E|nr:precorrin-6A reductase [Metasolibacillus meyeri]